ncbi:hypothetical protein FA15DRAFT_665052 [Coprinopsis marcescibilis]|uniref:F-box domain-containing protein n=1 Tax=Coprinopsis marcescibilis TaxID=230819 RepID=A0A5C3L7V2_COPMA|nr:hypothetical protein FA15DRAFT_665052 [Coprinopsis marcescibilis]
MKRLQDAESADKQVWKLELPCEVVSLFRSFEQLCCYQRSNIFGLINEDERRLKLAANPRDGSHIQQRIEAYRSLFAPIRRLPAEILLEIFSYYLFGEIVPSKPWYLTKYTVFRPLRLAAVCSFWRHLVMSSPSLWTNATFEGRQYHHGRDIWIREKTAEALCFWMDRVAATPWNLTLVVSHEECERVPHSVPLPPLLRHAAVARLKQLRFKSDIESYDLRRLALPQLESLHMVRTSSISPVLEFRSSIPKLPHLTQLVLANVLSSNSLLDHWPWEQLTHLYIEGVTAMKWFTIVRRCTSLQRACFILSEPDDRVDEGFIGGDMQGPPVSLPFITDLTLNEHILFGYPLREFVAFPALRTLNIFQYWFGYPAWNQPALSTFGSITRLNVVGRRSVQFALTIQRVLEAAPMLEEIKLDVITSNRVMFECFTLGSGGEGEEEKEKRPRLAHLKHLDIHCDLELLHDPEGTVCYPFPTDQLVAMVKSRARKVLGGGTRSTGEEDGVGSTRGTDRGGLLESLVVRFGDVEWFDDVDREVRCRLGLLEEEGWDLGFLTLEKEMRSARSRTSSLLKEPRRYWDGERLGLYTPRR